MSDSLQEHYGSVVPPLKRGSVVPFLGAGINLYDRRSASGWEPARGLPGGAELADYLARKFNLSGFETTDLLRVSQYAATKQGTGTLYEELRELFTGQFAPTPVHEFLAGLPGRLRALGAPRYQVIVTTNYDDALERTFEAVEEPYDVVWYIADGKAKGRFWHRPPNDEPILIRQPRKYSGLALEERTVILKIHGAVDRENPGRDSYVITEDHYIDYLTKTDISGLIPAELLAKLLQSRFLFLGYRLQDWNLRVILHRIWGEQALSYVSWAIQLESEQIERELWSRRAVEVYDVPLKTYIAELSRRLDEVEPEVDEQ